MSVAVLRLWGFDSPTAVTVETVAHRSIADSTTRFCSNNTHGSVAKNRVLDESGRQLFPVLVEERPLILRSARERPRASVGLVEIDKSFGIADWASRLLLEVDRTLQVVDLCPRAQGTVVFELAFAETLVDVDKDLQIDKTIDMLGKLHYVWIAAGCSRPIGESGCHCDATQW